MRGSAFDGVVVFVLILLVHGDDDDGLATPGKGKSLEPVLGKPGCKIKIDNKKTRGSEPSVCSFLP